MVTIEIKDEDVKLWAMMNAFKDMGIFDIKYGRATLDFDGQGKVSNVKLEKNYRMVEFSTQLSPTGSFA